MQPIDIQCPLIIVLIFHQIPEKNLIEFRGPYLQEKFVRLVEIEDEKKEQIKLKCWAGFATEDKMRDELKYSASILKNTCYLLSSENKKDIMSIMLLHTFETFSHFLWSPGPRLQASRRTVRNGMDSPSAPAKIK